MLVVTWVHPTSGDYSTLQFRQQMLEFDCFTSFQLADQRTSAWSGLLSNAAIQDPSRLRKSFDRGSAFHNRTYSIKAESKYHCSYQAGQEDFIQSALKFTASDTSGAQKVAGKHPGINSPPPLCGHGLSRLPYADAGTIAWPCYTLYYYDSRRRYRHPP